MNFEDRLLAELKAGVAGRAARRRRPVPRWHGTARWRGTAGGVAAATAAVLAAIVVPTVIGSQTAAAYAVTTNADGSITVTIKEFRDAGRLEKDLAVKGVRAGITYLPQRMRCGDDSRGVVVDPPQPHPLPTKTSDLPKAFQDMLAHRPPVLMLVKEPGTPNTFKIFPRRIKDGQTLVLERGESQRTRLWKLSTYVVTGPVRPCVFENDPNWN